MAEHQMPERVWLRKCGGGFTLPSGTPYLTVTGDDRELPRHVEYVRANAANTSPAVADLVAVVESALRILERDFPNGQLVIDARAALSRFRELEKGNG